MTTPKKAALVLGIVIVVLVVSEISVPLHALMTTCSKQEIANSTTTTLQLVDSRNETTTTTSLPPLATQAPSPPRPSPPVFLLREMIGNWVGKTWIPPHPWRYFDPVELREMYKDKKVLWMGDSTGRRAFATMYAILNETSHDVSTIAMDHPSVIDVNKKQQMESCNKWTNESVSLLYDVHPRICRPAPGGGRGEMSLSIIQCFNSIETILNSELAGTTNMTADVDVIVIAVGIWEVLRQRDCNSGDNWRRRPMERLDDAIKVAANFTTQTGKTIVWRTSGYAKEDTVTPMNELNNRTMDAIDALRGEGNASNFMYVNWGAAMQQRSFGPDASVGDMAPHYGWEARLVLLQMITNALNATG